jgi:hypothetical protein
MQATTNEYFQENFQDRDGWLVNIVDAEENSLVHSNLHDYCKNT